MEPEKPVVIIVGHYMPGLAAAIEQIRKAAEEMKLEVRIQHELEEINKPAMPDLQEQAKALLAFSRECSQPQRVVHKPRRSGKRGFNSDRNRIIT